MQVNYTLEAYNTLFRIVNFVEAQNTLGAGLRWLDSYELFLKKALIRPDSVPFCHNTTFNQLQLRCIYYYDWVLAFSIENNIVNIEAILHKSRITD